MVSGLLLPSPSGRRAGEEGLAERANQIPFFLIVMRTPQQYRDGYARKIKKAERLEQALSPALSQRERGKANERNFFHSCPNQS
jgi:hypothetical protein